MGRVLKDWEQKPPRDDSLIVRLKARLANMNEDGIIDLAGEFRQRANRAWKRDAIVTFHRMVNSMNVIDKYLSQAARDKIIERQRDLKEKEKLGKWRV